MAEDIKINEVQQMKDATHITVILENGSLGKIAKTDLVELIKSEMLYDTILKDKYQADSDLDNYTNTGYYDLNRLSNNNAHFPPNMNYGGLVVISCNLSRWVLQLAYSVQDNKIRTRTCNDMGIWQEWYER